MTRFGPKQIRNRFRSGFSLIETLLAISILLFMMASAAAILGTTQKTWSSTWERTTQFRDARLAFELITRNLSQATLNTYWDYVYDDEDVPTDYRRESELHFYTDRTSNLDFEFSTPAHCIFFQAVLGYSLESDFKQLDALLNARGYYIAFGNDDKQKPKFLATLPNAPRPRWRYRLMEYLPPTENNMIYQVDQENEEGGSSIKEWFSKELIEEHSRPVVDNIIALIVSPQTSPDTNSFGSQVYEIAPFYRYDSRDESVEETLNVLPPLVEITVVAIDEASAVRLQDKYGESPPPLLDSEWFSAASDLDEDLDALKEKLNSESIGHRIFSTTVAIRSAKWSH